MKIRLDGNTRKYIEIEIELDGKNIELKYYEKTTKQIKELNEAAKKQSGVIALLLSNQTLDTKKAGDLSNQVKNINSLVIQDIVERQFLENLKGNEDEIKEILDFYEENGNIYELMNQLDETLGKQKKRG